MSDTKRSKTTHTKLEEQEDLNIITTLEMYGALVKIFLSALSFFSRFQILLNTLHLLELMYTEELFNNLKSVQWTFAVHYMEVVV